MKTPAVANGIDGGEAGERVRLHGCTAGFEARAVWITVEAGGIDGSGDENWEHRLGIGKSAKRGLKDARLVAAVEHSLR